MIRVRKAGCIALNAPFLLPAVISAWRCQLAGLVAHIRGYTAYPMAAAMVAPVGESEEWTGSEEEEYVQRQRLVWSPEVRREAKVVPCTA